MRLQKISIGGFMKFYRILMENMRGGSYPRRAGQPRDRRKFLIITLSHFLACTRIRIQMRQFHIQYSGLKRIQSGVATHDSMMILLGLPVICNHLTTFCSISIDRKSTRLNSSHVKTSYAVLFMKKKSMQSS